MSPAPKLPTLTPDQLLELHKAAQAQFWRLGDLSFLSHATQKLIDDAYRASKQKVFYLLCSRRLGKSHYLVRLAFETCLKKKNARVLFLAPFANDAALIAKDLAVQILETCPEALKPKYNQQEKEFSFPNGSILRLKGTNGEHARYLRGGAADLVILDECALMDDLKTVLGSVVMPMILTTGGRIVLATTPPTSPGHDSAEIYERQAGKGAAVKFTIKDAPHVTDDTKVEFLVEAGETYENAVACIKGDGFPKTTTAQREYWCCFVTDASRAVLPEFDAAAKHELVKEHVRPDYFDSYTALDPGFRDRTGILFGYVDFLEGKLIIADEALLDAPSTLKIAETIKQKEADLWMGQEPLLRVSDVDLRLRADLWALHKIKVQNALKQDSLGAINLVRNLIQNRKIIIDPRCTNLVRQMTNAIWNNRATDFDRPGEGSIDGHYDLVAALKYLCRSIQWTRNPYPSHFYGQGGRFGMKTNQWRMPVTKEKNLGLFSDTPFGRMLADKERKR